MCGLPTKIYGICDDEGDGMKKVIIQNIGLGAYQIIPVLYVEEHGNLIHCFVENDLDKRGTKANPVCVQKKYLFESEEAAMEYIESELLNG